MKNARPRIRLANAVAQIRRRYPKITPESIRFATMVFYPVALVEVVAQEKSVEEFDPVQRMILQFIGLGLGRDAIAELTGLTPDYIRQSENLLYGYGHIAPGIGVTEIGWESIANKAKIEYKESKRHVQLDALSLSLIPYEKSVDETTLFDKSLARGPQYHRIGAIGYPEGIDSHKLEQQLLGMDFGQIDGMEGVHVNIVSVSGMECLKMQYAVSCMLRLDGWETPIVFGRRRGQAKGGMRWMPFGAAPEVCRLYGLDDTGTAEFGDGTRYLDAMKTRFDEKWETGLKESVRGPRPAESDQANFEKWNASLSAKERSVAESKALVEAVLDFYSFEKESCLWKYQRQGGTLMVGGGAFTDTRRVPGMVRILFGFAKDGVFPLSTEKMLGRVVAVRPMENDAPLREAVELLREAIQRSGEYNADKYLQNRFADEQEDTAKEGGMLYNLKEALAEFLAENPLREE